MRAKFAIRAMTVVTLLLQGNAFAGPRPIEPQALQNQKLVYQGGTGWVVSEGDVTVALSMTTDGSGTDWLALSVINNSAGSVTLTESQVAAFSDGAPLHVWTLAELRDKEESKQRWRKIGAAFAAGLNAYAAGQQGYYTQRGTIDGTVRTTNAYGITNSQVSGTYTASGYDPAAAAVAQQNAARQNADLAARIAETGQSRADSLEAFAFHSQTIQPRESLGGHVRVDLPRRSSHARLLHVRVALSGDQRDFALALDGALTPMQLASLSPVAQSSESIRTRESVSVPPAEASGEPQAAASDAEVFNVSIVGKRVMKCPKSPSEMCVFFDLAWHVPTVVASRLRFVDGNLVLAPTWSGVEPLAIEWRIQIPGSQQQFTQAGVGFPISKVKTAEAWLLVTDPTTLMAKFSPQQ